MCVGERVLVYVCFCVCKGVTVYVSMLVSVCV